MKVILVQSVAGQGRTGDIINVADAYARNFLLPKKLARPATDEIIARAQTQQRQRIQQAAQHQAAVKEAQGRLNGKTLALTGAANARGTLFAAIKSGEILMAVKHQFGLPAVTLRVEPDHLKTIGQHQLTLLWPDRMTTRMTANVTAKDK